MLYNSKIIGRCTLRACMTDEKDHFNLLFAIVFSQIFILVVQYNSSHVNLSPLLMYIVCIIFYHA